jgi:hypothetical protein
MQLDAAVKSGNFDGVRAAFDIDASDETIVAISQLTKEQSKKMDFAIEEKVAQFNKEKEALRAYNPKLFDTYMSQATEIQRQEDEFITAVQ